MGISAPRPELGELMKECANAATLYDETLYLTVTAEGMTVEKTWHEEVYDAETDRARYEVQQRYWRRGRDQETADDLRHQAIRDSEERLERGG